MRVDSGPLAAIDGVWDVCNIVRVRITDSVGAGDVGYEALVWVRIQAAAVQRDAQVRADSGLLLVREGDEEGGSLDGGTIVQIYTEEVVLGRSGQAGIRGRVVPVLEASDGQDRLVVDSNVRQLQVFLPVREGGFGRGSSFGGVGAVGEGHDVAVQRGDLTHGAGDILQGREEAEGLVGVLVAVAPRAPVDSLAPVILEAGSARQVVLQAGSEDDFPRCEGLLACRQSGLHCE